MMELRNATAGDNDFLFQVYQETNVGMFEHLGPDMCETLLRQQSSFQESHYDTQYPELERFIIESDDRTVGRLYLAENQTEVILVDIALLSEEQKDGIGTQVLTALIKRATSENKAVRLHVVKGNPARHWYEAHGFKDVALKDPYVEMIYRPV